ncbi:MAG: hypothetical protein ACRC7S_02245, partial [Cetobacterium sp.]
MTEKRKVSPNERMYLAFEKNYNSFVINRIVEGRGDIDIEILQSAVNKVGDIYPESRFKLKNDYWIDSKLNPKVIKIQRKDVGKDFKELMKRKIDLTKDIACEVYYLNEFDKITIIFRTHHGVMDGKGQGIWIEAIFKELNNLEIEKFSSKVRDIDLLKDSGINKSSDIVTIGNYSPLKDRASYKITDPISKKIEINEKINSITAKLIGSIHKLSKDSKSRFIITRDIREKFPEEKLNTGNLSLPMYLETTSENWQEINKDLINTILKNEDIK